jgi:tetratricopeptide (TPR) repeat protein
VTPPLPTLRSLARRPSVRAAAIVLPLAGFAAGWLPLLDAPGYELAEAGALLAALVLAPWLGIAAARLERGRAAPSPTAAFGAAAIAGAALLALFFAANALRAALGPCRVLPSAGFLPALAGPSLLLGSALAVAITFVARGRRSGAALLYALVVLATLAATLRAAYLGPAASALDPLLGYWPGPLYDERLPLDPPVVAAGAEAIAWAVLVVAWTAALVRRPAALAPATGLVRVVRAPWVALLLATAALGALSLGRARAGAGRSPSANRAAIVRALGARRDGARCTLFVPAEKPAAAAAELLRECEFHVADVARVLRVEHPPRVTVFVYRSAEEKRRLVGAAATEYTKPWLAEIHLGDAALPHPVLRHELVHAIAAEVARGPLGVPARGGVLVSMGLVEGLAVALEIPRSAWTVHEWSRAARDLGLLPDVGRIVGPAGFWAQAPARAYTAAGSFIAFLSDRYGAGPVRAAYAAGDLATALGKPLPELVAEWQRFLDETPVPEGLRTAARARLGRASVFARPCAREAAALEVDAAAAAAAGRVEEACTLYDRSAALTGSPGALKARADVLARAGALDEAAATYRDAALRAGGDAALRAAIAAADGDLAWRRGDVHAAAAAWTVALAAAPDRADARLLEAKRVAASDPDLGAAARPYLLGLEDSATALARLARVRHPLSAYLLGRTLAARGDHAGAAAELARAIAGPLPAILEREARLGLGEARCASGAVAEGEPMLRGLRETAAAAERERIEAGLRRCAFEVGESSASANRGLTP